MINRIAGSAALQDTYRRVNWGVPVEFLLQIPSAKHDEFPAVLQNRFERGTELSTGLIAVLAAAVDVANC